MRTLTANMFTETNEDMPIISGMARTEVVVTVPDDTGLLHHFKMAPVPIDDVLPLSRAAELLFNQGKQELRAAGFTVTQSSWYGEKMVVVASCEIAPSCYGHSRAEFIATHLDGKWIIQRSSSIK